MNSMIRILQSKKDDGQDDGLEGLCLLHFNGMETSAIALTDKVLLQFWNLIHKFCRM